MITGHGGNVRQLANLLGCPVEEIIDMSSNLNPLGPPAMMEKIMAKSLKKIRSLPEPDALSMRKGFASYHGIDVRNVAAGNGTTWFIHTIPLALGSKKVLIAGPSYSDYQDACAVHDIPYRYCFAVSGDRFVPDIDRISDMAKKADTVFICNPNNPTGSLLVRSQLVYLLERHRDTVFIIDESYLPFVDNADDVSLVSFTGYENLAVLSSMSKIFTIPGLRTGFLSGAECILEKINAFSQPWSVNALAQAAIEYIFEFPENIEPFYKKTREYIKREKQKFCTALANASSIALTDSCTCFILAELTGHVRADRLCAELGRSKILIRNCSNFAGLSDSYVRFSLKDRRTNEFLSAKIKESMEND